MAHHDKLALQMDLPPQIPQPNVFPLSWHAKTQKMEEIWDAAQREFWDPKKLPWDTLDVESYSWEEREAIAYWWTLLSVFDASAPPVFASALIKTYVSGPGRLRGTFMKSSGFSAYHLFMASMGGTCPRAFWGMW